MKQSLFIAALLIAALTFYACKKPAQQPASEQKAAVSFDTSDAKTTPLDSKEAQNVYLRYHPAVGSIYVYRLTSMTEEKGTLKTDTVMNMKTSQGVTYMVQVKMNEYEEDSTLDMSVTVNSVKIEANTGKEKVSYESGKQLDAQQKEQFSEYEALVNNSFGVRLRSNGAIVEIYKTDKISNKILQMKNISKDTIPAQKLKMFKDDITFGLLAPVVQPIFRELSGKPISKDNKWFAVQEPLNLQVVAFGKKIENTLTGVELLNGEKTAAVDIKLLSQSQVNPQNSKMKINLTKYGLAGQGKMFFNLQKGMNQKTKSTMILGLGMSRPVPTAQGMQTIVTDKTTTVTNVVDLVEIK